MTDWPTIVRQHGPLVWRTAHRLLNHDADAADCFQRTFLAAVELDAIEPVRNWPAALARLATARALEQLRVRYRNAGRNVSLGEEPIGRTADPIEGAAANELADRLRGALAAIDPKQAETFCLICLDGWSNQDAARLMGITAGHAGVLLQRARAALRAKLAEFDPARERHS